MPQKANWAQAGAMGLLRTDIGPASIQGNGCTRMRGSELSAASVPHRDPA